MEKIRVLHVVNSLDPGGMENGVVNMVRELQAGFEFRIACLERRGKFADRLPESVKVTVLGKTKGVSLKAALELALEIKRFKPDLIHTHNLGPLIYASLATLGGMLSSIVHGEHSQLTSEERGPRRLRQRQLLFKCCRQIHTVSQAQREELVSLGFSAISTIINGVDVERFAPGPKEAARKQFSIPSNAIVMGIVARFGPFKGHSVLLDAFNTLAMDFPNLHLLIVGAGGPTEAAVRAQAEQSGVRARIQFAGFQPEPRACYQALDFLIVPSVNEGLSNAVLEAKACGIPVLAHTACGNAEVINSGYEGLVMDLGNSPKIQEAVRAILDQKCQFPHWAKHARQRAITDFSLAAMGSGYARLYRSVASRGNSKNKVKC